MAIALHRPNKKWKINLEKMLIYSEDNKPIAARGNHPLKIEGIGCGKNFIVAYDPSQKESSAHVGCIIISLDYANYVGTWEEFYKFIQSTGRTKLTDMPITVNIE